MAVDALGADRVLLVRLPSKFTSLESMNLAQEAADLLGCKIITIPIVDTVSSLETALLSVQDEQAKSLFDLQGTTVENLQARSRAVILMGISNATGLMLLSTGNKSEMSVGYCTLYADMCGGYNALKDTWKTDVFELARWRNLNVSNDFLHGSHQAGLIIPQAIIDRAPSAELAPGQSDENTLGLYAHLDAVLKCLIEKQASAVQAAKIASQMVGEIISVEYALKCARLVRQAEHKRRQAPPGVVAGPGDFSKGWRLPITNAYGV